MLALVVSAQVHFALETLGTNVTSERFEARVLPAVGDEVGALAERFAAHLALVRLFTCRSEHNLCEGAANSSGNRPTPTVPSVEGVGADFLSSLYF